MKYSGFDIVLDSCSEFSLSDGSVDKNVIIFGADMNSLHINNKTFEFLVKVQHKDSIVLHLQQRLNILLILHNQMEHFV